MQTKQRFEYHIELICGISDLPPFYRRNWYNPIWLDGGRILPRLNDLLATIRSLRQERLNPKDYHLDAVETLLQEINSESDITPAGDVDTRVGLELLCTDMFLIMGSDLLAGRINPETLYAKWIVVDPEADFAAILQKAVDFVPRNTAVLNKAPDETNDFGLFY